MEITANLYQFCFISCDHRIDEVAISKGRGILTITPDLVRARLSLVLIFLGILGEMLLQAGWADRMAELRFGMF